MEYAGQQTKRKKEGEMLHNFFIYFLFVLHTAAKRQGKQNREITQTK